jgi:hypothetical protein
MVCAPRRPRIIARRSWAWRGSRPAVGSSSRISSGSPRKAWATPTRACGRRAGRRRARGSQVPPTKAQVAEGGVAGAQAEAGGEGEQALADRRVEEAELPVPGREQGEPGHRLRQHREDPDDEQEADGDRSRGRRGPCTAARRGRPRGGSRAGRATACLVGRGARISPGCHAPLGGVTPSGGSQRPQGGQRADRGWPARWLGDGQPQGTS